MLRWIRWVPLVLVVVAAGCGSSDAGDMPTATNVKPSPISAREVVQTARRSGLSIEEKLSFGSVVPGSPLVAVYGRSTDQGARSKLGVELMASVMAAVERQKLLARSRPVTLRAFRVGNVLGWHRAPASSPVDKAMHRLAVDLSRACRCLLVWFR